jgi:tape measure domain-containing protein
MAINLGMITFGLGANISGLAAARAAMQGLANVINQVGQSAGQTGQQLSSFNNTLRQTASTATLVAGPLSGISTRLTTLAVLAERFSLQTAAMVGGIAAGTFAFLKLSTSIITTERSLQQYSQTLAAVYNSQTVANTTFTYLADLSNRTGVAFGTLAKQYGQVEAASKGTSLEGERARKVFESVTFAAAKLGLGGEELEGTLRAIQQIISKGTVQMEELKGQLGDRLPGAVQIYAQALGVTTTKLQQMIQKGEVGAGTLTKFADALVRRYNIDTAAKLDTISAAEGRLSTARTAALDQLDKILGVSNAYKNALNFLADGLTGASAKANDFVKVLVQLGIAFAAAFAAPRIIDSIGAIVAGISQLTRGIWALNAATAAGAFTSFVKLLATATIAIGAYYASEKLVSDAIGKTADSYLKAKPAVEDYINAQKSMVSSIRQPTREYIKEQGDVLDGLYKQKEALEQTANSVLGWADTLEKAGLSQEQINEQMKAMSLPTASKIAADINNINNQISGTKKNLSELHNIYEAQSKKEDNPLKDPTKDLTTRQEITIKKAEESIRNLKAKYDNLFLSPAAKQYADVQEEVNHQVEMFKENLERAEIPADKIKKLVEDFGKSLRTFKDGELAVRNMSSAFQEWADIFGRSGQTALSNFVDVIVDGKDKMVALADTARAVAKDILNTFLRLAALNPLKNALFGTNEQVLGGNAGLGGLLGKGLSGLFGGGGASTGSFNYGGIEVPKIGFANGGIMTQWGSVPLRKYAGGGVANGPQAAIFGEGSQNEAFVPLPDGRRIPVSMQGGGGGGSAEVHIHTPEGHQTRQTSSKSTSGGTRIDVEFVNMVRNAIQGDIAEGGPMSKSMERQFGLNRAKGLSG